MKILKQKVRIAALFLGIGMIVTPCVQASTVDVTGDGSDFYKIGFNGADAQFSLTLEDEPPIIVPTVSKIFIEEGAVAIQSQYSSESTVIVPNGLNAAKIGPDGTIKSWENANLKTFGLQSESYRINFVVEAGEPLVLRTVHGVKEVPAGFFSTQFAGGPPELFDTNPARNQLGSVDILSLEALFIPGSHASVVQAAETPQMSIAKGALD